MSTQRTFEKVPSHLIQSSQPPERSEQKKHQLFKKLQDKFNSQLNPKRNEVIKIFIDKTLKEYIFEQNKLLSAKELNALEAKILQYSKENPAPSPSVKSASSGNKIKNKYDYMFKAAQNSVYSKEKLPKLNQKKKSIQLNGSKKSDNSASLKKDMNESLEKSGGLNDSQKLLNVEKLSQQSKRLSSRQSVNSRYSNKSIPHSLSVQNIQVKPPVELSVTSSTRRLRPIDYKAEFEKYRKPIFDYDNMSISSTRSSKSVLILNAEKNRDEYAAIVDFKTKEYYDQIEEKKQKISQAKKQFQEELEAQLREQEEKKKQEKKDEMDYFNLQQQQQKTFDENIKFQEDKSKNHYQKMKSTLQQQIMLKKYLEKKEKKEDQEYEKGLVNLYKKNLEDEVKKIQEKKERNNAYMKKIWQESLQEREEVEQANKNQLEKEKEQTGQFGQILEELNTKRELQQKKRLQEQKKILNRWDNEVEKKKEDIQLQNQIEQQKLKKQQQQIEQKFLEDEKKKTKRVDFLRDKMLQENQQQQEFKNTMTNPLKQDRVEQGKIWVKEDQEYWQRQREILERQKRIQKEYQKMLELQIRSQDTKHKQSIMSKNELLQNKGLLKKIAMEQQASLMRNTQQQQNNSTDRNSGTILEIENPLQGQTISGSYQGSIFKDSNLMLRSVKLDECNRL